jgi:hypothetical protein
MDHKKTELVHQSIGITIMKDEAGHDSMRAKDVLACQFGQWFTAFEDVTYQTKVLTISEEVVDYFLQGSMDDVPQRAMPCDDDAESSGWNKLKLKTM